MMPVSRQGSDYSVLKLVAGFVKAAFVSGPIGGVTILADGGAARKAKL